MTVVRYILPAIRAKLAQELVEKHGFKSKDAAEKLGLTQAAISQYISSKRGQQGMEILEKSTGAKKIMDELIEKIITNEFQIDDEVEYLCRICETLRNEGAISDF
jgi:hypothetical protein